MRGITKRAQKRKETVMSTEFASAGLTAGQLNAIVKKLGGHDMALCFLRDELVVKAVELLLVTIVSVTGSEKFVATEAFGENNPDGIRFHIWDDFRNNFLGKIEEKVPAADIAVHRLEKSSRDPAIMAELDIDPKVKKGVIKLAHFYKLIKAQANGEDGPLLVNGYANIAYVEDKKGSFWAVDALWFGADREWSVNAYSVGNPLGWGDGRQVISQV